MVQEPRAPGELLVRELPDVLRGSRQATFAGMAPWTVSTAFALGPLLASHTAVADQLDLPGVTTMSSSAPSPSMSPPARSEPDETAMFGEGTLNGGSWNVCPERS